MEGLPLLAKGVPGKLAPFPVLFCSMLVLAVAPVAKDLKQVCGAQAMRFKEYHEFMNMEEEVTKNQTALRKESKQVAKVRWQQHQALCAWLA